MEIKNYTQIANLGPLKNGIKTVCMHA